MITAIILVNVERQSLAAVTKEILAVDGIVDVHAVVGEYDLAGRYYMNEPLFIRPEDSGTATSPTIIRGEEGTILCGDKPQRHVQLRRGGGLRDGMILRKCPRRGRYTAWTAPL